MNLLQVFISSVAKSLIPIGGSQGGVAYSSLICQVDLQISGQLVGEKIGYVCTVFCHSDGQS